MASCGEATPRWNRHMSCLEAEGKRNRKISTQLKRRKKSSERSTYNLFGFHVNFPGRILVSLFLCENTWKQNRFYKKFNQILLLGFNKQNPKSTSMLPLPNFIHTHREVLAIRQNKSMKKPLHDATQPWVCLWMWEFLPHHFRFAAADSLRLLEVPNGGFPSDFSWCNKAKGERRTSSWWCLARCLGFSRSGQPLNVKSREKRYKSEQR